MALVYAPRRVDIPVISLSFLFCSVSFSVILLCFSFSLSDISYTLISTLGGQENGLVYCSVGPFRP